MADEPVSMADRQDVLAGFRAALRLVPSPVYLVTSRADAGDAGMTATAVSSLSFDPPSMLVCVNRSATLFGTIEVAGRLALSLLSQDDQAMALDFGQSNGREERFRSGAWAELDGLPVPSSAVCSIACDIAGFMDYGTHRIFIGNVTAARHRTDAAPLLYVAGGFASAVSPS